MGVTEIDASSFLIGGESMHVKHLMLALRVYKDAKPVLAALV